MKSVLPAAVIMLVLRQAAVAPGAISGIVINDGAVIQRPLSNARLELTDGPSGLQVTRSDPGGRFEFSNLSPGRYKLTVTRDGYVRQTYPRPLVISGGGQIGDITFRLAPAAIIAGWVQDDAGAPIPNVLVEALRRGYDVRGNRTFISAASAATDDRGEYRIFWLDPGEYFFYASSAAAGNTEPERLKGVVPTYYPGVTVPEEAKPLRVDLGREINGVDFRLALAALTQVTGYLTNAITGRPVVASVTLARPAEDPDLSRWQTRTKADGRFTFSEPVPPGSFVLNAKGVGGEDISGSSRIVIRSVRFKTPPYEVRLALSPPIGINGRLISDSGTMDLRGAAIMLTPVETYLTARSAASAADGQFLLKGMTPGDYILDVSGLPDDLYVKAARYASADALEQPIALQPGAPVMPLQVLAGADGGRLKVSVFNNQRQLHEGAQVVLVPDSNRRHRRDQYRLGNSGEDGTVSFRGIPPGQYKAFAWEELEENAYLNSDYLKGYEDLGTPVRIEPGDNAPIGVRLIPRD